ncbi:MAG TPA: hemolysin family protein [Polyangiaceae bacterium]|nr:hemolysin family protein [Polyangiaceae bacterium]
MQSWWGVALAGVFILLNGFFVGAEFALVKVRDSQLAPLAKKGNKRAAAARDVARRLDRFLSTSQLGITLSSLALGWIGEPALAYKLEKLFLLVGVTSQTVVRSVAFAISFFVLSTLHILFGELVPKFVGLRRTLPTALFSAQPLKAFRYLFLPFLWLLDLLSDLTLRALGMPPTKFAEGAFSEEEIRLMLDSEHAREQLPEQKRALLVRVLRSADRPVRLVMVPRVDVAYLSLDDPIELTRAKSREHEFSRFPVVREHDLDQIVGYVHVRDLFYSEEGPAEALEPLLREPQFVPETATVAALLERMSAARVHLAIVVDEYGGTSGVVTLEDLLEEIVGEIQDEFDTEPATMARLEDGSIRMQGTVAVADATAYLRLDLAEPYDGTIGGYVIEKLGRIPRKGDRVPLGSLIVEVLAVRRRRIAQVLVRPRESGEHSRQSFEPPRPSLPNND